MKAIEVKSVFDGKSALDIIESFRPDLVLLESYAA